AQVPKWGPCLRQGWRLSPPDPRPAHDPGPSPRSALPGPPPAARPPPLACCPSLPAGPRPQSRLPFGRAGGPGPQPGPLGSPCFSPPGFLGTRETPQPDRRILAPPEASFLPLLSKAMQQTWPVWPLRGTSAFPLPASPTLTTASGPQTANVLESSANATHRATPLGSASEKVSLRVARPHTFTSPAPYPSPGFPPRFSLQIPLPEARYLPLGAN